MASPRSCNSLQLGNFVHRFETCVDSSRLPLLVSQTRSAACLAYPLCPLDVEYVKARCMDQLNATQEGNVNDCVGEVLPRHVEMDVLDDAVGATRANREVNMEQERQD